MNKDKKNVILIGIAVLILIFGGYLLFKNKGQINSSRSLAKLEFTKEAGGLSGNMYLDKNNQVYLALSSELSTSSLSSFVKEYSVKANDIYNSDKIKAILLNISGVIQLDYLDAYDIYSLRTNKGSAYYIDSDDINTKNRINLNEMDPNENSMLVYANNVNKVLEELDASGESITVGELQNRINAFNIRIPDNGGPQGFFDKSVYSDKTNDELEEAYREHLQKYKNALAKKGSLNKQQKEEMDSDCLNVVYLHGLLKKSEDIPVERDCLNYAAWSHLNVGTSENSGSNSSNDGQNKTSSNSSSNTTTKKISNQNIVLDADETPKPLSSFDSNYTVSSCNCGGYSGFRDEKENVCRDVLGYTCVNANGDYIYYGLRPTYAKNDDGTYKNERTDIRLKMYKNEQKNIDALEEAMSEKNSDKKYYWSYLNGNLTVREISDRDDGISHVLTNADKEKVGIECYGTAENCINGEYSYLRTNLNIDAATAELIGTTGYSSSIPSITDNKDLINAIKVKFGITDNQKAIEKFYDIINAKDFDVNISIPEFIELLGNQIGGLSSKEATVECEVKPKNCKYVIKNTKGKCNCYTCEDGYTPDGNGGCMKNASKEENAPKEENTLGVTCASECCIGGTTVRSILCEDPSVVKTCGACPPKSQYEAAETTTTPTTIECHIGEGDKCRSTTFHTGECPKSYTAGPCPSNSSTQEVQGDNSDKELSISCCKKINNECICHSFTADKCPESYSEKSC